ncbi:hypothetical protein ACFL96_18240, partial [Thermoproteota archaeon]
MKPVSKLGKLENTQTKSSIFTSAGLEKGVGMNASDHKSFAAFLDEEKTNENANKRMVKTGELAYKYDSEEQTRSRDSDTRGRSINSDNHGSADSNSEDSNENTRVNKENKLNQDIVTTNPEHM